MVNIDKWDGPLPQSYIDGQHELQNSILARERELGMSPVLCAFAGHVPEALKVAQPTMKVQRIPPGWGGFSDAYGCWFLNPLDAQFKEIQIQFLKEQQKEYGTSHYYGTDPFNEIAPRAGSRPIWPACRGPFTTAWRKKIPTQFGCKWPGRSKHATNGLTTGCQP